RRRGPPRWRWADGPIRRRTTPRAGAAAVESENRPPEPRPLGEVEAEPRPQDLQQLLRRADLAPPLDTALDDDEVAVAEAAAPARLGALRREGLDELRLRVRRREPVGELVVDEVLRLAREVVEVSPTVAPLDREGVGPVRDGETVAVAATLV